MILLRRTHLTFYEIRYLFLNFFKILYFSDILLNLELTLFTLFHGYANVILFLKYVCDYNCSVLLFQISTEHVFAYFDLKLVFIIHSMNKTLY